MYPQHNKLAIGKEVGARHYVFLFSSLACVAQGKKEVDPAGLLADGSII